VADAYRWMHEIIGDGHVVVLRAGPAPADDDYERALMAAAPFGSIRTLCLPEFASARQLERAAAIVTKADAVFFAGGNQRRYVSWKGSALMEAVQGVYDRGGVVGGSSAGLAILGQHVFDARLLTAGARSFTHDMLDFTPLRGVITDSHFTERNRLRRLWNFMKHCGARGIGVDEGAALVIDGQGMGRLLRSAESAGRATMVDRDGGNMVLAELKEASDRFDFRAWRLTPPNVGKVDLQLWK
jgi:beta-aspartyl-peptidase (threonine type)